MLCTLPRERDVQNFLADRLRSVQGRSYSIEREPHVADEKEPDIRARSATDASVPIEIKIAESWTLEQLQHALRMQLCGRYLRARDAKHGILLLAHQKPRPRGWTDPRTNRRLTFPEVVEFLRQEAREIASTDTDAPQPEIAVIDVSTSGDAAARDAGPEPKLSRAKLKRKPITANDAAKPTPRRSTARTKGVRGKAQTGGKRTRTRGRAGG